MGRKKTKEHGTDRTERRRSPCSLGTRPIGSNRKIFCGISSRFFVSYKTSPFSMEIYACVTWWLSGTAQGCNPEKKNQSFDLRR